MPYLLDGMNVIHSIDELFELLEAGGPEAALNRLAAELARIWPAASDRMLIVMDGGGGSFGSRRTVSGISVRYPPAGETGDDLIRTLVENAPAYYVLVTDDKRMAAALSENLTGVMSTEEFMRKLYFEYGRHAGNGRGNEEINDDELGFWMRVFGAREDELP